MKRLFSFTAFILYPAAAMAVDVSGTWDISFTGAATGTCSWTILQDGTALTISGPCDFSGLVNAAGTIDLGTGAFFASGSSQALCGGLTLSGTASLDGNSLNGSYNCSGYTGSFTGTRQPPVLNWMLRSSSGPSPRQYPAMAYDSARGVTVLFGGFDGTGIILDDTWEWNGTTWTQRSPATNPPAYFGNAMAYDSVRGVTVLIGNHNFDCYGDTWEWNGVEWTLRSSTGPALQLYRVAYDNARGVTVLYGGIDCDGFLSDDTWEWNGTTWSQRSPAASPPARDEHSMAYDSSRGLTVLFGGIGETSGTDTWEWDGTSWIQRNPATHPPHSINAMVYDSARSVTVLLGAYGSLINTWEWNGTTWTQRSPATNPPLRYRYAMAYDSARGVSVLFGGSDNVNNFGDTWEYGDATCQTQQSPLLGLTIITHGYQSDATGWVTEMANAIAERMGGMSKIPIYKMVITDPGSRPSFNIEPGTPNGLTLSSAGAAIVKVDWSELDGGVPCNPWTPTGLIGDAVTNELLAQPNSHEWLSLPVHLIGHSRGASVMSRIALNLAEQGIWVDQSTSLDPHPVTPCGDQLVKAWSNVLFADNYYRFSTGAEPLGEAVPGTYELDLSLIVTGGGYDCAYHWYPDSNGTAHEQVHTYYHGTIDHVDSCVDNVNVNGEWYEAPNPGGWQRQTGYFFSRKGGGDRRANSAVNGPAPFIGLHYQLRNSQVPNREPICANPPCQITPAWPNATIQPLSNTNYNAGQQINFTYYYQDTDSNMSVTFAIDNDTNPFNTSPCFRSISPPIPHSMNNGISTDAYPWTPTSADVGSHFIQIKAEDSAGRVRYDYLLTHINIAATNQPDSNLVIENFSITPTSGQPGGSATVSLTIHNVGTGIAYASKTNLRFSPSNSTVTTADAPLAIGIAVPNLLPGATYPVNRTVTIPGQNANGMFYSSGPHFVWVILDVNSEANQGANEADDTANRPYALTVPPPPSAIDDFVQVYNTQSSGLRVRSPNPCDPPLTGLNRFDGATGKVIDGPQLCNLGGTIYTLWKVQWSDCLIGWSAQNWMKTIPSATISCAPCLGPASGDMNVDGQINARDIQRFVTAMISHSVAPADVCPGDFNASSVLDPNDLEPFVTALLGQ